MPSPSTVRQPRSAAAPQQRRLAAGGTRGRRRPARRAARPGRTAASSVPIPTDVALTTTSAPATSLGGADPTRPRPAAAASSARAGVRLTTTIVGGAGPAERVDDAARRRPGADDGDAGAGDGDAGRGQRGDEAVAVGAVADERPVAGRHARCSRSAAPPPPGPARRPRRRRPPCAASSPTARRGPSARIASSARRRAAGAHLEGDVRPVEPGRGEGGVVDRRRQRVRRPASRSRAATRTSGRSVEQAGGRGGGDVGLVLLRRSRRRRGRPPRWPARSTGTGTSTSSGSPAHSGSPTLGFGAGLSAARIDARPGLAIGVGGSPWLRYVLYGPGVSRCSVNGDSASGSPPACAVP